MLPFFVMVISLCAPPPALLAGVAGDDAPSASGSSYAYHASGRVSRLREAWRRDPQSAEIHNELGLALGDAGDLAGALAELKTATQLDANYSQAHYNLAVTFLKQVELAQGRDDATYYDNLQNASNEFRRAYQLAPDLSMIHMQLGWIGQEIGNFSAALEEFQLAVKEDPRSALSLFGRRRR